jgi:hypothetical protein
MELQILYAAVPCSSGAKSTPRKFGFYLFYLRAKTMGMIQF